MENLTLSVNKEFLVIFKDYLFFLNCSFVKLYCVKEYPFFASAHKALFSFISFMSESTHWNRVFLNTFTQL